LYKFISIQLKNPKWPPGGHLGSRFPYLLAWTKLKNVPFQRIIF